jgi:hypothetical protein
MYRADQLAMELLSSASCKIGTLAYYCGLLAGFVCTGGRKVPDFYPWPEKNGALFEIGGVMSASFNSEELDLLAKILEQACAEMTVTDEVTRSLIAKRILHLAQRGERDPRKLLDYATNVVAARCAMADSQGSSTTL